MTLKAYFVAALLVGVVAVFAWERDALTKLRQQKQSLQAAKAEADRLKTENRELPALRLSASPIAPMSSSETSELLRLRNEIGRLRALKPEVDKLRAENQRLATDLKSGRITPRKLSDMEGFVAREKWTHAGFATPESAVQSFFSAITSTNIELFVQCMMPEVANELQSQIKRDPERFRNQFMSEDNPFKKVVGFRIAEKTTMTEDKVVLGIQVAADGEVMPLTLRRVGSEWKLDELR